MKQANLIYGLGTTIVVIGAAFKILHLPGAEVAGHIYKLTFLAMFLFMSLERNKLKKRIKELEG